MPSVTARPGNPIVVEIDPQNAPGGEESRAGNGSGDAVAHDPTVAPIGTGIAQAARGADAEMNARPTVTMRVTRPGTATVPVAEDRAGDPAVATWGQGVGVEEH